MVALSHPGVGPNGITVDATNSALTGDTVTPQIGASASVTYSTAQTIHQSSAFAIATGASAVNANLPWTLPTAFATIYFRGYLRTPSSFATAPSIGRILSGGSGGTQAARLAWNASGNILIRDSGNITRATSTNAMTTSTWYRLEGFVTQGASGTAEIKFWTGANIESTGAPTETLTAASFNYGTSNLDTMTWGQVAGLANVPTWYLADTWLTEVGYVGPTSQGQQFVLPARWQLVRPLVSIPRAPIYLRSSLADAAPDPGGLTTVPIVRSVAALPRVIPAPAQFSHPPLGSTDFATAPPPVIRSVSGRAQIIPTPARFVHPALGSTDVSGPTTRPIVRSVHARAPRIPARYHYSHPPLGYDTAGSPFLPGILDGYIAIEIAFGADLTDALGASWVWTDVTEDVLYDARVSISVLRADETSEASPASCSFTLLNDNLAYSAYNPMSPNYPNVRKGTPVRVRVTPGTGTWHTRFQGQVAGFPPSWDITGQLPIVSINANGVLRRLTQGKTPLQAPLYRAAFATTPVAAWMLDDPEGSTSFASATGGPALSKGNATPGVADTGLTGTSAVASMVKSTPVTVASLKPYTETGVLAVRLWVRAVLNGDGSTVAATMTWNLAGAGSIRSMQIQLWGTVSPPSAVVLQVYDTAPAGIGALDTGIGTPGLAIDPFDGEWHEVFARFTEVGSDVVGSMYVDGVLGATRTFTGESLNVVSSVNFRNDINGAPNVNTVIYYSTAAFYNDASAAPAYGAGDAWTGENPLDRIDRLCAEQGVALVTVGTSTQTMGPQTADTFTNLLHDAERVDGGLLFDGLGPGLGYVAGSQRYNATPSMTLDMDGDPPEVTSFNPIDDDQRIRNLVTVTKTGSTGTTLTDEDGPLGTNTVGVYDTSVELNVETLDATIDQAGIRLHQGTIEGMRYPSLSIDLAATPTKVTEWLGLTALNRLDVLNPAEAATGADLQTIEQIVEGYSEVLWEHGWVATVNASPFAPWRAFVIEDSQLGRLRTDGSELHAAVGDSDTSMTVDITDGPSWITTASKPTRFPLDIEVGGEQITVGAIADVSATRQTFSSLVRSVNGIVKAHEAGSAVQVWRPGALSM